MNRPRAAPRETLNLRIKAEERGLIDRAARSLGKTRTDFVLEAARRAAEEALMDRTVFTVSAEAYAEFLARLDAPRVAKPERSSRLPQRGDKPGTKSRNGKGEGWMAR